MLRRGTSAVLLQQVLSCPRRMGRVLSAGALKCMLPMHRLVLEASMSLSSYESGSCVLTWHALGSNLLPSPSLSWSKDLLLRRGLLAALQSMLCCLILHS